MLRLQGAAVDAINPSVELTEAERVDRLRLIRPTMSGRARFGRWSIISAQRAPRWSGCLIWRAVAVRRDRGVSVVRMKPGPNSPQAATSASPGLHLARTVIRIG
jgi:hypothetical protein